VLIRGEQVALATLLLIALVGAAMVVVTRLTKQM